MHPERCSAQFLVLGTAIHAPPRPRTHYPPPSAGVEPTPVLRNMLQTTPDPQERSPPKPPRSKNPAQSTCNPRPRSRCNNGCNTLCSSSCNPIQRRREAIPGNKPAAAQAPCTPPPPGNTPHGQPISFSQPIILKDDRREDQPGHAVDLPDPAADGAVR